MTFEELRAKWNWKAIPHCPGRFRLVGVRPDLPSEALFGCEMAFSEFTVEAAHDTVVVATFDGGGLISYKRGDGTYVHTLNTPEGFTRKMGQLGIDSEDV